MRRIVIWLASTVTVVVLLFGYHTSTDKTSSGGAATSASSPASSTPTAVPSAATPSGTSTTPAVPDSPSSSPSSTSPSSPASSSSSGSTAKNGTYTGSVAQTRWGPVQVSLTVTDGTITKVTVLQQPNGNPRDVEINDQALPVLIQSTLDAQSADIDMVSGATVTSEGYLQSLQAALDKSGI